MILTVDIGNTNIKVGAWDKEELVFVSRLQTNPLRTSDEYAISLLDIFRLNECNASQFDGAIIASVVPQLSLVFQRAVRSVIQSRQVFLVSPGLRTGLNIKIDNPATLGADIVCAGVAATEQYPLPCIVISMGTATVIFALDKDGAYLGGTVSPGVQISLDALAQRTAQLPHISLEEPGGIIGTNTVDCMKAGIIYGNAAMVDGIIERMKPKLGENVTVAACGGIAPYIAKYCHTKIIVNDDMVLRGLYLIYQKNARG